MNPSIKYIIKMVKELNPITLNRNIYKTYFEQKKLIKDAS